MSTVIVHYDEQGKVSYRVEGDVRLLIVDERAPDDRVYEISDRLTPAEISAIVGNDIVGSRWDNSEAAKKIAHLAPKLN